MADETFISVSIIGDSQMRSLNKKYLKKDRPTDVLSFNMDEKLGGGEFYLGDVIVNKDQAKRQAKEYGNSFEEEVAQLVAHGVLHLLGVHHEGDGR
ncbi:rRNA maturation RNase YbeY [candidate division WWE3 bacterium]|nr:rRNA maturation RNase YbeY [candidate division WWE3 bacterium]